MDKFIKTPSSSDVDVLIEKFRLELSSEVGDSDDDDTRKLTIIPTASKDSAVKDQDIDKQINDLEDMIRKLQDEISEMSKNADKDVEYTPLIVEDSYDIHKDFSNETIILGNESEDSETLRSKMKNENVRPDIFDTEQFSHVFPLMLRDVILPLDRGFTIISSPSDSGSGMPERKPSKNDVVDIWNDLPDYKSEDNLDGLICDLQAEISERMDTLKDVIVEETSDNPDVKFEDA